MKGLTYASRVQKHNDEVPHHTEAIEMIFSMTGKEGNRPFLLFSSDQRCD